MRQSLFSSALIRSLSIQLGVMTLLETMIYNALLQALTAQPQL